MPTRLDEIVANTRIEVAARKAAANHRALEQKAAARTPRGFTAGLKKVAETGPSIIAEIKKASPSRGLIRADFNPSALARTLESSGAAALSVLTDEKFFQGSLANLELASAAVQIPCLRKDFTVDPFQVLEARASGADAILLIVAALSDTELRTLGEEARTHALDVLCETHNREEMDRALSLGFTLVGVNSRDLRTFTMHPELLHELAAIAPSNVTLVAESGLRTPEEINALRTAGYSAFLIGESLMRQPDPGEALAHLLSRERAPQAG
ncbi:indole-3-glycerol phosphate synthase [Edaphobacter acidisoli]|uniref:Indole-3-glycerol phosphate synthase n=1 Tax=Edaphobacter acidisoli TaxID=2040573 RepID=A0A916RU20_9BACT|nr:indole-3-glycerol phosphate synthase TrpC [Edaphobacter acidisoli]GGA69460.1 indole-3-glycerol phosphate synthase [Edaphobacter acidisoli]